MTDLLTSEWVFVVLFLFAVLDGFFPPIPSETAVIALATTWVAGDGPNVVLVALVAAAGAFAGDQLAYVVGRRVAGRTSRRRRTEKAGTAGRRARSILLDRGGPALLAARFIPGGRVVVTTTAGALSYPRRNFMAWTAGGALAWAAYYAMIGSITGTWLRGNTLAAIVIGVAGGSVLGWLVDRGVRRRARHASALLDDDSAGLRAASGEVIQTVPPTHGSPPSST